MTELLNLRTELVTFLATVDVNNFNTKYDIGGEILKSYRGKGLSLSDVNGLLLEINDELPMDDYQEDVFLELSKMLSGHVHDNHIISWW